MCKNQHWGQQLHKKEPLGSFSGWLGERQLPEQGSLLLSLWQRPERSMPAPLLPLLLLLRTLGVRLLLLARQRLLPLLRRLRARLGSRESREALLACLLCILNLRKKVDD
ncbi:hypothetical protein Y1Q_0013473 [Alligator mississippiensis]|uniref:Uncharacterized protein n=2 Tax=Alligator mississippiensis TaxID=8496 RepID=A0A151P3A1_ALLMI|nr:hypothetical protein Y1Q_0013473 [Alligator mississippiensis]